MIYPTLIEQTLTWMNDLSETDYTNTDMGKWFIPTPCTNINLEKNDLSDIHYIITNMDKWFIPH